MDVVELDIDKLKTVPVDLNKLSNAVDNLKKIFVKKNVYHKLVTKVNAVDTSGFALKTQIKTDKSGLQS